MSINTEVIFRESPLMFRVTGVNKDVAKDKHYITNPHTAGTANEHTNPFPDSSRAPNTHFSLKSLLIFQC